MFFLVFRDLGWVLQPLIPKDPKTEKIKDLRPGLQFSSEIEHFKRAAHQTLFLWGILDLRDWTFQGRDWNFQARLKISIEMFFLYLWALSASDSFSSESNRAIWTYHKSEKVVKPQGQISVQGISHLRNPNLVPNFGKRILDARILDPNPWVEIFDSIQKRRKTDPVA